MKRHVTGKFLEQRCRSPLPGLPLFLRDVFHVVDVGSGLRQDVVEVIADADEGESLFQELADTRSAEQEQPEN